MEYALCGAEANNVLNYKHLNDYGATIQRGSRRRIPALETLTDWFPITKNMSDQNRERERPASHPPLALRARKDTAHQVAPTPEHIGTLATA